MWRSLGNEQGANGGTMSEDQLHSHFEELGVSQGGAVHVQDLKTILCDMVRG